MKQIFAFLKNNLKKSYCCFCRCIFFGSDYTGFDVVVVVAGGTSAADVTFAVVDDVYDDLGSVSH